MKKRQIIFIAIIVAIVVGLCVAAHYLPVWVSVTTVISFLVGAVSGWFAKVLYDKYVKE